MRLLRAAAAAVLLLLPAAALGQVVQLPQVTNAGGSKVGAQASVSIDSSGTEKGTAANPTSMTPVVTPATSTPALGTVTSTAVTPTSGTGTLAGGTAVIPFTPALGLPIRIILRGGAAFSAYVGTSIDGCTTINPLTIAGQQWGSFTSSANEFVDTPETTATAANIKYCLVITVTSGTETYGVRQ